MSAHSKFVVWFAEVDKHDIAVVGGKGANLGEMTQAKLPVPPGFIVTASAYFYFLEEAGVRPKIEQITSKIDYNDSQELQKASREIQKIIRTAPVPKEISDLIVSYYFKLSELKTAHEAKSNGFLS